MEENQNPIPENTREMEPGPEPDNAVEMEGAPDGAVEMGDAPGPEDAPEVENTLEMGGQAQAGSSRLDLGRDCYEWGQALLQAIIAIVLVFAFVASIYSVKGESMDNTLADGEILLVSNLFYTPKQGDIVMFTEYGVRTDETTGKSSPFVKRVVGVEGQRVEIIRQPDGSGAVRIDGQLYPESYLPGDMDVYREYTDYGVVPEGKMFVMGDNRNNSLDSRSPSVGFVDRRFLLGKVLWRLAPLPSFGSVYK